MHQLAQNREYWDYSSSQSSSFSSTSLEKKDDEEILVKKGRIFFYPSLIPYIITDYSTTNRVFDMKMETFTSETVRKRVFTDESIENDLIFKTVPNKRYSIKINVKTIREGKPTIDIPDDLF